MMKATYNALLKKKKQSMKSDFCLRDKSLYNNFSLWQFASDSSVSFSSENS